MTFLTSKRTFKNCEKLVISRNFILLNVDSKVHSYVSYPEFGLVSESKLTNHIASSQSFFTAVTTAFNFVVCLGKVTRFTQVIVKL